MPTAIHGNEVFNFTIDQKRPAIAERGGAAFSDLTKRRLVRNLKGEAVKNPDLRIAVQWDVDAYDLVRILEMPAPKFDTESFPAGPKAMAVGMTRRPNPPSYCGVLPNRVQHLPWSMKICRKNSIASISV